MVHVRILTVLGPLTVCWVKCGVVIQGEIFFLVFLYCYEIHKWQIVIALAFLVIDAWLQIWCVLGLLEDLLPREMAVISIDV